MKKALVIANMMFASATVFGMMPNDSGSRRSDNCGSVFNMNDIRREVEEIGKIETKFKVEDYAEAKQTDNIQLITAAENNDFKKVKKIINRHIDKSTVLDLVLAYKNNQKRNEKMSHEQFAQHHKCIFQSSDIFKLVNFSNEQGTTLLLIATMFENNTLVEYLVEHGAEIDKAEDNGVTPLIMSALDGRENVVKFLVEHGADINKQDRYKRTPLFVAIDNENIVRYLIEHGADVNKEWEGEPPLLEACRRGSENIVKCLIEHGADISEGALFCACISRNETNENIVRYLVEHGADINKENRFGKTPLFHASIFGHENIVRYLIECGADVNKENYFGETPLFGVCEFRQENIVRYLVEHGANVNKKDRHGRTPLSIARRKGFDSIVEYLSQHGAVE